MENMTVVFGKGSVAPLSDAGLQELHAKIGLFTPKNDWLASTFSKAQGPMATSIFPALLSNEAGPAKAELVPQNWTGR